MVTVGGTYYFERISMKPSEPVEIAQSSDVIINKSAPMIKSSPASATERNRTSALVNKSNGERVDRAIGSSAISDQTPGTKKMVSNVCA
jgi:hypothetical protein